jgi:ribosomal protein S18 acetylase RimI-like enzyme
MNHLIIRSYRAGDEDRVRGICFDTALFGRPMRGSFGDRRLVTDALLGYYLEFESESLLVAEVDGDVAGYLSGCLDTARFERLYARRIVPALAVRFALGGAWLNPSAWSLLRVSVILARRAQAAQRGVLGPYPAHLHANVDARYQGRGVGSDLLNAFLERLREVRVGGVHLSTGTDGGKAFFGKNGFVRLRTYAAPALLGAPSHEIWLMGRTVEG